MMTLHGGPSSNYMLSDESESLDHNRTISHRFILPPNNRRDPLTFNCFYTENENRSIPFSLNGEIPGEMQSFRLRSKFPSAQGFFYFRKILLDPVQIHLS